VEVLRYISVVLLIPPYYIFFHLYFHLCMIGRCNSGNGGINEVNCKNTFTSLHSPYLNILLKRFNFIKLTRLHSFN